MLKPYFDSIILYCLLNEIQSIIGEKLKGVTFDNEKNLYLIFAKQILFASTHPSFYRVHLLFEEKGLEHSRHKSVLKSFIKQKDLRKHPFEDFLKSYKVLEIRQLGLDRIFYIKFSKNDRLPFYYLLFELTGPSSNISLLNSDFECIFQQKKRTLKKTIYSNTMGISAKKVVEGFINNPSPKSTLRTHLKKLPPYLENTEDKDIKKPLRNILNGGEPFILYQKNIPQYISPIPLEGAKRKDSFSAAVKEFYDYLILIERKKRLKIAISKRIKSLGKTIKKLTEELATANRSAEFKKKGELILVNLKHIKKGEKQLRVNDPYENNRVIEIEMDPSKSPTENAEEYFKKSRKAEKSKKIIAKRLEVTQKEMIELENTKRGIDSLGIEQINSIEVAFPAKKTGREKEKHELFRTFFTANDKKVIVGRNRFENEKLTFEHAKSRDIFFHIREAPGSHTILVNDGKLTRGDIIEAAKIAAYYSRAKHSNIVPVSYTERRYVRRSKKLGPGKVILTKEKTVFVKPEIPSTG
ncbi:MAG: hypothetical protein B5M53_01280 [Candidatus Cloacimonas sp. 4484_209]|nr:MAG: hypothetical protein B5M53_01280 [Candidatus Cloacimonas sp. 4484_209]